MAFAGWIESVSKARVTGWVVYDEGGGCRIPKLELRFYTLGSIEPTAIYTRDDGVQGAFIFELPERFQELSWSEFLAEFDGVHAENEAANKPETWSVPFFKSVLNDSALQENRTALLADKLGRYKLSPEPNGRMAAFTIVYNEHLMLPLWARHYAAEFGAENTFVIDQGSDESYDGVLPEGVTVIRIPRDQVDYWLLVRIAALMQRFLLESYDSVLYSDCDEFVFASPEARGGRRLREFLLALPEPIAITKGYNLHHDVLREPAYDPSLPVLLQRRVIKVDSWMHKPLVSRVPLNWAPGFHKAREGGVPIDGLYMLHLKWFDLNEALRKGSIYRTSRWNEYDIKHRFAEHQHWEDKTIEDAFHGWSNSFSSLQDANFDETVEMTIVPDWMHDEIRI